MKYLYLLLAILAIGCGKDLYNCDVFFYTSGLQVCTEENSPVTKEEVDTTVSILQEELLARYALITNIQDTFAKHNVIVQYIRGDLARGCTEIDDDIFVCNYWINGVNHNSNNIYIKWYSCPAYTSLAHELMHSIEEYYLDGGQHDHTHTPYFFSEYAKANNLSYGVVIEDRVQVRLSQELGCESLFD